MSIVGTRPPLISETNLYEPRHKVMVELWLSRMVDHFLQLVKSVDLKI